jgi:hypothetical protein
MPFAACPSCSQQNFTKAADTRTLKCSRCGQVYWVKADAPSPGRFQRAPQRPAPGNRLAPG